MKKYNLNKDEISNIESRQGLIKQYQYLIHVINADIEAYLNFQVCKRLGVPENTKYELSKDNKEITLHDSTKTE